MNLLPEEQKNFLRRFFKARYVFLTLNTLSVCFIFGILTLLPPYFLTKSYFDSAKIEAEYKNFENTDVAKEIINLPNEINLKMQAFQTHISKQSMVDILSEILSNTSDSIKINSFSFIREGLYKEKKGILLTIAGSANDRMSLTSFISSIKEKNPKYEADLPVSSFTKDKNIPFSLTVFIEN